MKKVKHDHKGTKALKLTIFFSLMLAPMLAVLFKCCYVTFNKNAYQSYGNDTNTQLVIATTSNALSGNTLYISENTTEGTYNYSPQFLYTFISIDYDDYLSTSLDYNPDGIQFYSNGAIRLHNPSTNSWTSYGNIWRNTLHNLTLVLKDNLANYFDGAYVRGQIIYETKGTLDNAFYYAIDEMKNNQLFNWTTNTVLYTPTAAMTSGMGITTTALPILITYWLYLTAIYIVIDIVIELFTYLTHMITSRLDT